MRNRQLFFCLALVVAVGLLAAPAAMATGNCSTYAPTVTVEGPCPVVDPAFPACADAGGYTGIKYTVGGSPSDHAAVLVTKNNEIVPVANRPVFEPCVGDNVTGLGKNSCHERTVKLSGSGYTSTFWIVVKGTKTAALQSIALKKHSSNCVKSLAVAGLGFDVNPFQAAQKVETVNFKGCAVKFVYDVATGSVLSAAIDPDESTKPPCGTSPNDGTCCAFYDDDVSNLELTLNGQPLGAGQFGEGYVSSGVDSCTTRVIGGKVYTWGSPCP